MTSNRARPRPRTILAALGTVVVSAGLTLPTVASAATRPTRVSTGVATAATETVTDLGAASLSSAIVTGVLNGDKAFVVSRAITPANLGVLDRTTGILTPTPLPGSQGAWASAVIGSDTYIASYLPAVVYKVGADGSSTNVAAPSALQLFYDMAATPDGLLVGGGYPQGHLYVIDPVAGATSDWGQAATGEQYVRSVAADSSTIYAGVGAHAHLIAFDRATRAERDILPKELLSDSFVYDVAVTDRYVIAGMVPSGKVAIIDKADPTSYRIVTPFPDMLSGIDALTVGGPPDHPMIYGTARPQGSLFSIDATNGASGDLGVPMPGEETRNLYVEGNTVVGFAGSGGMWTKHLDTGAVDVLDLQVAGLTPGPELPLSLEANKSSVLVGGNFGLQIHDLDSATSRRVRVAGEPKAQVLSGNIDYLAVYPSGTLQSVNIVTGKVKVLTTFGNDQIRPRDMVRTDGLFLIGTQPQYGQLGGALVVYNQNDASTQVYRNVIPRQSIASVATDGTTAYLGSEVVGGTGSVPTEKQAVLAFFDLGTRTVTKSLVPVAGAKLIIDVVVVGTHLVGVTETGVMFEVDRATGVVTRTKKISTVGGQFQVSGSWMTFTDGIHVLRIDTETWDVTTLATGLAGAAQGVLGAKSTSLFTTRGTDLVKVTLP